MGAERRPGLQYLVEVAIIGLADVHAAGRQPRVSAPGVESFFSQGVQEGRKALRIFYTNCMEVRRKTPWGFR